MPRVCCNRVAPDHDLDTMSELVLMGHKCIGDGGTDFLEMSQATAVIELILEPYIRLVWTFKSPWSHGPLMLSYHRIFMAGDACLNEHPQRYRRG